MFSSVQVLKPAPTHLSLTALYHPLLFLSHGPSPFLPLPTWRSLPIWMKSISLFVSNLLIEPKKLQRLLRTKQRNHEQTPCRRQAEGEMEDKEIEEEEEEEEEEVRMYSTEGGKATMMFHLLNASNGASVPLTLR